MYAVKDPSIRLKPVPSALAPSKVIGCLLLFCGDFGSIFQQPPTLTAVRQNWQPSGHSHGSRTRPAHIYALRLAPGLGTATRDASGHRSGSVTRVRARATQRANARAIAPESPRFGKGFSMHGVHPYQGALQNTGFQLRHADLDEKSLASQA